MWGTSRPEHRGKDRRGRAFYTWFYIYPSILFHCQHGQLNRKTKCFQEFTLPFSYSKGMHNFLKVSDFRKCSSFPKYKFVMTTSTENMTMNASFLKKSAISKNHHKFYFSVHLTSYTNLMSHFSRAFINYFPNVITLSKQWI